MMFKKFSRGLRIAAWPRYLGWVAAGQLLPRIRVGRRIFDAFSIASIALAGLAFTMLFLGTGCQTVPPFPAIDLQDTAWRVQEGQAVWRSKRNAPEIAGEFLLATRNSSDIFVQFTKNPFPMVIAQASSNAWQLELPMQNKRYSGRGKPPERLVWLYLPKLINGASPPDGWKWERVEPDGWRLANQTSGELIEGFLNQ
jgi:hypothetical protein